ncbi:MAG TPA: ImmA/IrrE family metallo-endopeptidase [Xanthobacteraceae bacterium]|nr:ImmA/IrrE family metallo-endopeptidase [Xanthobacteraceae bacterium]
MEEADEAEHLVFVNSARMSGGVDRLVRSIGETLGVTLEQFRAEKSVTDAFSVLRAGAEKAGVFVLLMGNLGTHHTDIDVRIFRGFALADDVAPFVVINEKDSRAAWSFTLLHELAHIWLGQTGISGYDGEADVERFCDSVAARFLLAPTELEQIQISTRDITELKERVSAFAVERNLSRKMVAYNLLRSNAITRSIYAGLNEAFDNDRISQKKDQDVSEGGPNYYTVRAHRIGPGLIGVVRRMVAARALSTTKAAKVLGVKPTAVDRLIGARRAALGDSRDLSP